MLYKESSYEKSDGVSLDYQRDDIPYVRFGSMGQKEEIKDVIIKDPAKIDKIINYINSLEIVEVEKVPRNRFGNKLEKYGFISIYFGEGHEHNPGDIIQFYTNYMGTSFNGRDWEGKSYYVKNSGYDNKTKNSNVYQFLYDLINE